jgi:hypothetical protein
MHAILTPRRASARFAARHPPGQAPRRVEAVERHAGYEEQMRSLVKEALAADEEIERTGEVYRAADVHAWVERLARGQDLARPRPWRR